MKHTFDLTMTSEPWRWRVSMMVQMEWEREEAKFIEVFAMLLLERPEVVVKELLL